MYFEWDEAKAEANVRKHAVGFELARLVFNDPNSISRADDRRDYGEERWNTIGIPLPAGSVLLHVTHTVEEDENGEEIIRIISARKATPSERGHYGRIDS
ncbi:MAG: BrnT family toxin [Candidatus Omnitrophica bacterium]|nr:BrnT family toxin [Candidatus Omnitrophota bacterium]